MSLTSRAAEGAVALDRSRLGPHAHGVTTDLNHVRERREQNPCRRPPGHLPGVTPSSACFIEEGRRSPDSYSLLRPTW